VALDWREAAATWLDGVAALLLDADAGDLDAERRLLDAYRADGPSILGRPSSQHLPTEVSQFR
jgi:hypothetical protein